LKAKTRRHRWTNQLSSPENQVRYAATEIQPSKSARARGAYLRVSFKNTRETAQAINGWKLQRAVTFLENVKEHKEAVPMRRYAGSTGRCAQGTTRNFQHPPTEPPPQDVSPGGPTGKEDDDVLLLCSENCEEIDWGRTVMDRNWDKC